MISNKVVRCHAFHGSNISITLNLFCGPKFYIECGSCRASFNKRIDAVDYPKVICPHCGIINEIPVVLE